MKVLVPIFMWLSFVSLFSFIVLARAGIGWDSNGSNILCLVGSVISVIVGGILMCVWVDRSGGPSPSGEM